MNKSFLYFLLFLSINIFAQEHFAGFTTSKRVGLLNASINPSEIVNLKNRFEIQLVSFSGNVSNNIIGFSDITSGSNLKKKIFDSNLPVNFNVDTEILLPGVAFRAFGWGFGVQAKATVKANIVDVDTKLGNALSNAGVNAIFGSSTIQNDKNQRINGTAWGEIALTGGRTIFENDKHKFIGGVTVKLLFPGAYTNIGVDKFSGTISNTAGNYNLTNSQAGVNIAYSGNLANSFTKAEDYYKSMFGGINGFAGDIGVNYMLKSELSDYKIKVGASVRNIGSMTFKGDGNQSTDYKLSVQGFQVLNLNQFQNVQGTKDVEQILLNSGYLTKINQVKDVKVMLPTVFNLYADLQIIPKLNVTVFMQQKLNENSVNNQINSQNSISITPRLSTKFVEILLPIVNNETAGTTAGIGFRLGGFILGSNSIITAFTNDSKQLDAFVGFRFGIL